MDCLKSDQTYRRIYSRKNVADNAVFARSVDALKHNEQRVLPFRVHEVLQLRYFLDVQLNFRQSAFVGLMFPMIQRGRNVSAEAWIPV